MSVLTQVLLLVLGVLLSGLGSQVVSILSGMRSDIKALISRLDDEAEARHELSERVLILETEHRTASCHRKAGA